MDYSPTTRRPSIPSLRFVQGEDDLGKSRAIRMRPDRRHAPCGESRMAGRRYSPERDAATANPACAEQSMGLARRSLLGRMGCAGRLLRRDARQARRSHSDPFSEFHQPARKPAGGVGCRLAGTFCNTMS